MEWKARGGGGFAIPAVDDDKLPRLEHTRVCEPLLPQRWLCNFRISIQEMVIE